MTREIKFRAWDGEKMRAADDWTFGVVGDGTLLTCYNAGGDFNSSDEELKVMQYTGLEDKNGVEIYEGDFLKIFVASVPGKYDDVLPVVYDSEKTGFLLGGVLVGYFLPEDLEIVGNIYENPELLEEKK